MTYRTAERERERGKAHYNNTWVRWVLDRLRTEFRQGLSRMLLLLLTSQRVFLSFVSVLQMHSRRQNTNDYNDSQYKVRQP